MALFYNLPVYKASYGLTQRIFLEVENFSREYKYTTGQEMKNQTMELIKNIYRANREIGNIYLDGFDHFVREDLKMKFYGRYVDDMVFVHIDKEFLQAVTAKIKAHLQTELKLTLHPKKIYLQPSQYGVGFLGVFIKPRRTYINKRTKQNFFQKIKQENELLVGGKVFSQTEEKKMRAWLNSYLGIMSHYDTFKLRKKLVGFLNLNFLKFFSFCENFEKAILVA